MLSSTIGLAQDGNVPVGAGVMDCPPHSSARKPAPSSKTIEDIVRDGGKVAMMIVVKKFLETLEPATEGNMKVLSRGKWFQYIARLRLRGMLRPEGFPGQKDSPLIIKVAESALRVISWPRSCRPGF